MERRSSTTRTDLPASRSHSSGRLGILLGAALTAVACSLAPGVVRAQSGSIAGTVTDAGSGRPLLYINVIVVGTSLGALTQGDGSFLIKYVPIGNQTVQASCPGYRTESLSVPVGAGLVAEVKFRLQQTVAKTEKEVAVTAKRPLVDVKKASTTRSFDENELKSMTVQPTLDSVVEQQPGVTRENNEIHIRGGRSDETLYIVDGIQMRDLLSGTSSGSNVSARSVAEVNIITGGFDAKYGQALSGVIEAKLKEGTQSYKGWLGVQTDALIGTRHTGLYEAEYGGPFGLLGTLLHPLGAADQSRPTFYLDVGVDLEDGYLPSIKDVSGHDHLDSSYHESILGQNVRYGSFFYPRANNDWRVVFKTAWKASTRHKFSFSLTKSLAFDQGFGDTDPSEVDRNVDHYPWEFGSNTPGQYGFDRYYTATKDLNSASLSWIQNLRSDLIHTLRITRFFSARHQDVRGLSWNQYNVEADSVLWAVNRNLDRPYFKDAGDATEYRDQFVDTWSLDSDWIKNWRKHDIRWGLHAQYETVQYLSLDATTVSQEHPLGTAFDLFRVTPNTGAFYVQDRVEQEGLIAGVGLRYDYWFPGQQVEDEFRDLAHPPYDETTREEWLAGTHSLFGHRYKGHLSPRIQVSHPISEHDHLFFNYGHFSQRPAYYYVYSRIQSQPGQEFPDIGNPNLNPEISVQYELGAEHQFQSDMAVKASLFYKDIYDYPTSATVTLPTSGQSSYFVYISRDYARASGVELELRKRSGNHTSFSAAYTYSLARGKNSDPNDLALIHALGGNTAETDVGEVNMWWNRPHKLTLWFDYKIPEGDHEARPLGVRLPADVELNLYYLLQSGVAYTPYDVMGNQTGPDYSRNGPAETTLDGTLSKGLHLAGRRWELSLRAYNIFDARNLTSVGSIDPATGKLYQVGQGTLAHSSYSLAYLINKYSDPSLRSAPRYLRMGVGVDL